jgi:hypothetical protein
MKTFTHKGETWQVTSTGFESGSGGDLSMTVRFLRQAGGTEVRGRLEGIAVANFAQVTDEQLEHSLADALSGETSD